MIKQNDPRRWEERADGSMVREDHNAMANLSPNIMMYEIPHHDIPTDPSVPGNIPGYGRPSYTQRSRAGEPTVSTRGTTSGSAMIETFFSTVRAKGSLK